MKYPDEFKKCLNCKHEELSIRRGYCSKCYPLILKIEKIEKGILPPILEQIKRDFDFFDEAKKEYIWQVKHRLEIIKDSRVLKYISAHDLEYRINGTLKFWNGKSLGKINDPIAFYLKDDKSRSYVYRMFSEIQLLRPFKIDYYKIYRSGDKQ